MDVALLILERNSKEGGAMVSMSVFGAAVMVVLLRLCPMPVGFSITSSAELQCNEFVGHLLGANLVMLTSCH